MLWWLSPGEGWDAVTGCGWDKLIEAKTLKIMAQVSSVWAKGCMLDDCVCYLT